MPATLRNPHRFVAAWLAEDRKKGALHRHDRWFRHEPIDKAPIQRRRLLILSTLFLALEKRGHKVELERGTIEKVHFVVSGERLVPTLDELLTKNQEIESYWQPPSCGSASEDHRSVWRTDWWPNRGWWHR